MVCRRIPFKILPQGLTVKQWNNVLGAPVSNIDGFLWRDECVSSTLLNRPIWSKMSLSAVWQLRLAGSISIKKLTQFSQGKQWASFAASNIHGFRFGEMHVFLHLGWISLFAANRAYVQLETLKVLQVFHSKYKSILTWNKALDAPHLVFVR